MLHSLLSLLDLLFLYYAKVDGMGRESIEKGSPMRYGYFYPLELTELIVRYMMFNNWSGSPFLANAFLDI